MPIASTISAPDGDDQQRGAHRDLEEAFADPGDREQLDRHHAAGHEQRLVDVGDDERQRVKDAAQSVVIPPVIEPRTIAEPRPVCSPVSDSASDQPMLTPAPSAVARPTTSAVCELA